MISRHHSGHGIRLMDSSHAWSYAGAVEVTSGDVRPLLAILAGEGMFGADLSWQDDAPCGQADPELWFPELGQGCSEAKAVCRSCTSRPDCLRYALDRNEEHGVWGGLSHDEREDAARARRAGVSLKAILAEDDARFYVHAEAVTDRQLAKQQRRRTANQEAVRRARHAGSAQPPLSREAAA